MNHIHTNLSHGSAVAIEPSAVRRLATCKQSISVGLIGPGRVGKALLEQIQMSKERLFRDLGLKIFIRGIINSRVMVLEEESNLYNLNYGKPLVADLSVFVQHLLNQSTDHVVLIDCSASSDVPDLYASWIARGLHVVTPNKNAGSGSLERWEAICVAQSIGQGRFRQEATVGAGLPILHTLRDLLDTGDELLSIQGMFSGTLAWICNKLDSGLSFSQLVREAHSLGYTEPDPRDDLSGMDVARKLVILAREAGMQVSLGDVEVQNIVDPELSLLSVQQFMENLNKLDEFLAPHISQARLSGKVLRHVASLNNKGQVSVGLIALPLSHPFTHTQLTDNVIQFETRRYCNNPLHVQGPGAGAAVTASGVFSDLLRILESTSSIPAHAFHRHGGALDSDLQNPT